MMDAIKKYNRFENQLLNLEKFNKTQINLYNASSNETWAKLFGANERTNQSYIPLSFQTDSHPVVVLYNPLNELIYVVNQLAATLQLFGQDGTVVKRVVLDDAHIPTASPLAISLNPISGEAYILGSLSDKLYVINQNLELTHQVLLPIRPFRLEFNPVNQKLYVLHLIGSNISVLDTTNDFAIEVIDTGHLRTGLAINKTNGNWAVSGGENISIYYASNEVLQNIESVGSSIVQLTFSLSGNELLLVLENEKQIATIQLLNGSLSQTIVFEYTPSKLLKSESGYFLSFKESKNILELDTQLNIVNSHKTTEIPTSWTINHTDNVFFISDPITSTITVIDPLGNQSNISYSKNYEEVLSDFQYHPVKLKHLQVNYPDKSSLPFIRIGRKSSAGKMESQIISLFAYSNPQHFSPIYQLNTFEYPIIDGRTFWEVLIPPEQSVSLLIYHE